MKTNSVKYHPANFDFLLKKMVLIIMKLVYKNPKAMLVFTREANFGDYMTTFF